MLNTDVRDGYSDAVFSDALLAPERMNNKQHHRNRDAGIRYIKGRPGMRIWDVQIEEKKIDHVPIKKPIGKISKDPGDKKRQREITPTIRRSRPQEEAHNNHKRHRRNGDEKGIVASEGSKRCAGIGHANKTKEIRYQNPGLIGTDEPQNHLFGPLIQCVERKREKKNELHVFRPFVSCRAESRHLQLDFYVGDSSTRWAFAHCARNDRKGSSGFL